jgi:RimJ/RimL family protein N-acetyltransferase
MGTRLLELLTKIGRKEKLGRITAHILPENSGMLNVARRAGYRLRHDTQGGDYVAEKIL